MEIKVVCHILFEIYLIIVEFHPTITMKYTFLQLYIGPVDVPSQTDQTFTRKMENKALHCNKILH